MGDGQKNLEKLTPSPTWARLLPKNRLHHCPYPIIGLTGGVATGKSTVSNILKEQGVPVICADSLIKKIYKAPKSIEFIQKTFPNVIKEGLIDFNLLRKIVFDDKKKLETLENFLYPKLSLSFKQELKALENKKSLKNWGFIVYDIPLLFEKKLDHLFDNIILVYTPAENQLKRLIKRDKISRELAQKIIDAQIPIDNKVQFSPLIIKNEKDLSCLKKNVSELMASLK